MKDVRYHSRQMRMVEKALSLSFAVSYSGWRCQQILRGKNALA